jgi:hypothetical protein
MTLTATDCQSGESLAHLGIARAKARMGDVDGSRRAYEALFAIWNGADADFAPLRTARARARNTRGCALTDNPFAHLTLRAHSADWT